MIIVPDEGDDARLAPAGDKRTHPIPAPNHRQAKPTSTTQTRHNGKTANFCANCGNKLHSDSKFCDQCGELVLIAADQQGQSSLADDIKLPVVYKVLIQSSCGIVLVSFFLPWLGASIFSLSGWDILTSNISWHVLLAATAPIAAVSVAIFTQLLYANPTNLKTYFNAIETAGSIPLIAIIILVFYIGAENSRYDIEDIFKHLPDIAKLIGIGGWGTILGLIGIDTIAARLRKEGLELVEAREDEA